MRNPTKRTDVSATDLRIALSEVYPETSYGTVPVLDQYDALEAYRAYDDGGLQAVPIAFATYVSHQQRRWS